MSTLNDMDDVCTDLVDLINHLRFGEVLSADRGLQASGVFRVLRACEAYLETRNAQNFAPLLDNEVKQIRNAYASGMCREQLVSLKIQIIKNVRSRRKLGLADAKAEVERVMELIRNQTDS